MRFNWIASTVENVFNTKFSTFPILFVDYVSLLNNMPVPGFNLKYLKHIIYSYEFDAFNYSALADLSITKDFAFNDVISTIHNTTDFQFKSKS